eukprot:358811-Chlamydomonas_euryale.AAC.30
MCLPACNPPRPSLHPHALPHSSTPRMSACVSRTGARSRCRPAPALLTPTAASARLANSSRATPAPWTRPLTGSLAAGATLRSRRPNVWSWSCPTRRGWSSRSTDRRCSTTPTSRASSRHCLTTSTWRRSRSRSSARRGEGGDEACEAERGRRGGRRR